jgi:hypothetical protein
MRRGTLITLLAVLMVMAMSLGASAAFAGEITGNGKVLKVEDSKWGTGLHARSLCAYSGQEDDQFKDGGSKGVPGHAQSWGQIPKEVRDFMNGVFEE